MSWSECPATLSNFISSRASTLLYNHLATNQLGNTLRIKNDGSEFSPVAGKILMILSVHAKGAVNAVACGLGDMYRNKAIHVGDHRYHARRRSALG